VPTAHELPLVGLDRLLAERGEPPVTRSANNDGGTVAIMRVTDLLA
jgi:hypothetical protein